MKSISLAAIVVGLLSVPSVYHGWAGDIASRPKEYSVWLVPSGQSHDDLKKTIASLSRAYRTPDFEPHVTLVGLGVIPNTTDESVSRQVESLARTICPYSMNLQDIGTTDDPFRSLFLTVRQTKEVMDAGRRGLDLFRKLQKKRPTNLTYFPHLSLLYGNLAPADKEKIISEDLKDLRRSSIRFTVSKIQLWVTTAKIPDWPKTWDENWHMVKEFPLRKDAACTSRP